MNHKTIDKIDAFAELYILILLSCIAMNKQSNTYKQGSFERVRAAAENYFPPYAPKKKVVELSDNVETAINRIRRKTMLEWQSSFHEPFN